MERVKYIKNIRIDKNSSVPDTLKITATGIAELSNPCTPVLLPSREHTEPLVDGIYEFDFILENLEIEKLMVDLKVELVLKLKNIPGWIKGIKINAAENADIELIERN